MSHASIKNRSFSSNLAWKLLERGLSQGVSFIISIVLARLLEPTHFGTVSLLMVFVNLMQVFVDGGMGNALIQKKDADEIDFSTVLFFNIVLCAVMYLLIFLCAPFIASFYGDIELKNALRVLGIVVLISGLKNIQVSRIAIHMEFRKLCVATIVGAVISGAIGIFLAYLDFGIWAIVAQTVLNVLFSTIMLWIIMKWKPKLTFSAERFKRLFDFGWRVLFTNLINTLYDDISILIIGGKYSTNQLAYYDQGRKYPQVIISNINTSIDSVLFPLMSKSQDDILSLKNIAKKSYTVSAYILFPIMTGLAVCAENLVRVILTDKWIPCIPYIYIFCLFYSLYPLNTSNLNVIKSLGKSGRLLKIEIIKKVFGVSALLISLSHGVMGISIGILVGGIFNCIINAVAAGDLINYSILRELRDLAPTFFITMIMGATVFFVNYIPIRHLLLKLLIQITTGVIAYLVLSIITKNESYFICLNKLKRIFRNS